MIGKVVRGTRVQGLIRYLYGPGEYEEHKDPHIVAGFRDPADLEPALRGDGTRDFRHLDGLLTQPLALLGERNYRKPVWHLPVRAAPEDPILTDEQWAQVAEEITARTGLAPPGDDDAVRWVAVRHAGDHIHIVATLARADGERPDVWGDAYPIREACTTMEHRFGLRSTAPADRTAASRPKRAETEKARRRGRQEEPRTTLRRLVTTAAAGARSEEEFFTCLEEAGALVRRRFSERDPGRVTGYAAALPDDRNRSGEPVFYGGGKLAADLTLPKLRCRWIPSDPQRRPTGPGVGPPSADYPPVSGRHLSARTVRAVLRTTVREAAGRSRNADDFFDRLDRAGIGVRRRVSETNPGQVTGYAVTLPDHTDRDGQPVWFSGGRLADELTLPRLQERWNPGTRITRPAVPAEPDFTPEERQAFYDDAARAASYATGQIRRYAVINPHAARDAARAASDTLHVAGRALGNPHLRCAAEAYDRAARAPYGRIPKRTPAGEGLRTAARLLAMAGLIRDDATLTTLVLVANFIALMDAIAQLHEAQERTAQATAARSAGDHLRRAVPRPNNPIPWPPSHGQTPTPVDLAMADFPMPWVPANPYRVGQDTQGPRTGPERRRPSGPTP